MGERGEIDSAVVYTQHGQKTYFINIKENRYRDLFLTIAESLKNESEGFERFVVNVFEEDVSQFEKHLQRGKTLIGEVEESVSFNKELPDSWAFKSKSGSGERYFQFSIHRRARLLQLVVAERKLRARDDGFGRTIRIDAESLEMIITQYQRMMRRLMERKEIRDKEPIRNQDLVKKYTGQDSDTNPVKKVVRKVVVKRRLNADDQE